MEATIEHHFEDSTLIIDNIFVPVELRGKGIATQLMNNLIEQNPNTTIELHAFAQDEHTSTNKLRDFYEKFGFQVVAGWESIGYEMILN